MSQDISSVLLPASRVDFFALDDGTAATAEKLVADWRFARVAININRGGIAEAIEVYGQSASPELIIIETNDISEAFLAQLEGLAGVCAAGTDAVLIGPMNDVHLYRNLVGMGVRDYLVRPVGEDDMVSVIAKSLVDKRGISGSRLVAVLGAKGGVGTTAMAQILAWNISETLGQKTMLMDAAGSSGSLGIAYGIEPASSLTEVVRIGSGGSDDDMKRIIQEATPHLSMMVCGGDAIMTDSPDPDGYEALVNRIMQKWPVVVMDLSGTSPAIQKRMVARASEVVLVTTPLLSALRNARTLLNEIKGIRANLKEVSLVVNMRGHAGSEELPDADIKQALDLEPAAKVPYEPKIFIGGETSGKPVGGNKSAEGVLRLLLGIAEKASATKFTGSREETGKKESPLDLFKKKLAEIKGR